MARETASAPCSRASTRRSSRQRRPLKLAVERSVLELRGPAFIESLYPELSRGSRAVAAEEDEDDDDTEGPETDGPVTA